MGFDAIFSIPVGTTVEARNAARETLGRQLDELLKERDGERIVLMFDASQRLRMMILIRSSASVKVETESTEEGLCDFCGNYLPACKFLQGPAVRRFPGPYEALHLSGCDDEFDFSLLSLHNDWS